jgi:8-hydroxy-5-deazaflavin:NADPH oxidoreductase
MKIGVIGSAKVGQTLATAFLKEGHEVMLGTRNISSQDVISWRINNPTGSIGYFNDAVIYGEVIVLAVKGAKAIEALELAGTQNFAGKIVIDVTNPITDNVPPVNGVLPFFTTYNESLMEQIQARIFEAKVVKAFSCVGSELMYKPSFNGGPPTMFICGNDEEAKKTVTAILTSFGWETEDMGKVEAARAIEPLCILWCIPGFIRSQWGHAFKLLKQ